MTARKIHLPLWLRYRVHTEQHVHTHFYSLKLFQLWEKKASGEQRRRWDIYIRINYKYVCMYLYLRRISMYRCLLSLKLISFPSFFTTCTGTYSLLTHVLLSNRSWMCHTSNVTITTFLYTIKIVGSTLFAKPIYFAPSSPFSLLSRFDSEGQIVVVIKTILNRIGKKSFIFNFLSSLYNRGG